MGVISTSYLEDIILQQSSWSHESYNLSTHFCDVPWALVVGVMLWMHQLKITSWGQLYMDQLLISGTVAFCWKHKILWLKGKYSLDCGYKDRSFMKVEAIGSPCGFMISPVTGNLQGWHYQAWILLLSGPSVELESGWFYTWYKCLYHAFGTFYHANHSVSHRFHSLG